MDRVSGPQVIQICQISLYTTYCDECKIYNKIKEDTLFFSGCLCFFIFLSLHPRFYGFNYVIRRKSEILQQISRRAGMSEFVVDADAAYRSRELLAEQRAYSFSKASYDRMLFTGYDLSAFCGSFEDKFLIERLDSCKVDDSRADPLRFEFFTGLDGFTYQDPGSNDSYIVSVLQDFTFADLEFEAVLIMTAARASTSSAGQMTVIPGMLRIRAKSSQH